jgi:hypothetical protein
VKRAVLVILAVAAFAPSTAGATVPCRVRIYNDWYGDGKIATTYPIACYRDAIKHVRDDARQYSSLVDDIRAAMQGAIALQKGDTKVPTQIGNSGPVSTHLDRRTTTPSKAPHDPMPGDGPVSTPPLTSTVAAGATSGNGSGVPVPLLVLGGLALVLTAVGGIGVIAKRRRL